MTLTNESTNSSPPTNAKKTYSRPRLDTYGDIREIAKTVGMMSSASDGALHGKNKTE
jgi:hypothetical protein